MSDNSKFKRKRGANEDTLLFLLRSLHGKRVVVELDSNIELNGLLTGVDENMTCTLTDVYRRNMYFSSNIIKEDDTTVLGKHIRYVHLPDSLDVMGAMEKHVSCCIVIPCIDAR
jgi:small nuclear ribonucleoprotein (snRNP)-like protein